MSRSRKLRKNLQKSSNLSQTSAQKPDVAQIQQAQARSEYFKGPLPHPDILKKYDEILTGAANRIITMAENQAEHRQKLEKWREHSETVLSFTGQLCALIFVLVMIISAAYCIIKGQPWGGLGLGSAGIVGIIYAFIQGHKQKQTS